METKTQSAQAQVAKIMRQYCKAQGIECRATSDSFSMGDSVNVTVYDLPPAEYAALKEFGGAYQYGHFDGMTDMYEYSNRSQDIPQTKYLSIDNNFSDEIRQAAWDVIRATYCAAEDAPADVSSAGSFRIDDYWGDSVVYQFLNGSFYGDEPAKFWESRAVAPVQPAAPVSGVGYTIEEHTHTKRGFQMFIVILVGRVDRDEFNALRDGAKAVGGWYSRAWQSTPGGFAFKESEAAQSFADTLGGSIPDGSSPRAPKTINNAPKLRELADNMQSAIDNKLGDRLANTPKRQREAGEARNEGRRLQRTQDALRALADLHDAGTIPAELVGVTSKKAVYDMVKTNIDYSGGYYDHGRDSGEPADTSAAAVALWSLISGQSEESKAADELRDKINSLQFANIAGYFPTPAPVIALMMERARIQPGDTVLEPSAGSGNIADAVKEAGAAVECFEVHCTLREILAAKGHAVIGDDFTAETPPAKYDAVLMNPPFEKGQDIEHVRAAFGTLKAGKRLVSVMSPGPFFRSDAKATAFREWFDNHGGEKIDVAPGSFKESGTGVSTVIVILDKD
jgi:predicted RNA methylase